MTQKAKISPASKFLLVIVVIIVLFLIGFIYVAMNPEKALKTVFVPSVDIADDPMPAAPNYTDNSGWVVRPDAPSKTSHYRPAGTTSITQVPEADIFFIHPTTYLKRTHWNAPLDDERTNDAIEGFVVMHQLTPFSPAGQFYMPRYRQATLGAFMDDSGQGITARDRAYGDVLVAFDHYITHDNDGRPFIIVGHSQGSTHGLKLLRDRISGTSLADRMVAAYLVGWPISMEEDIGALDNIPACAQALQTGCVISWLSFAGGGDISGFQQAFDLEVGLSGQSRKNSTMLCTNPLNWSVGGETDAKANLGAVQMRQEQVPLGGPIAALTGAKCGTDGFLYLTTPPQSAPWTDYLLGTGNYHVYDFNLFYMNIRNNAAMRAGAWLKANED